jgi:hypothetical protein
MRERGASLCASDRRGEGIARLVRGAVIVVALGLAIAIVVFVVTGGHVVFLPLVFLPLVFFWPRRRDRHDGS